jgi:sugar lactone lactonase YvrE
LSCKASAFRHNAGNVGSREVSGQGLRLKVSAPHDVYASAKHINHKIVKARSTKTIRQCASTAVLTLAAVLLAAPAAAHGDTFYVSEYASNYVRQYTASGAGSVFVRTPGGPTGIAFDSAGNLYAAIWSSSTIMKFTPGGPGTVFASTGLNHPEGLAFDQAGNLYAANFSDGSIAKFTPGGVGSVFATGLSEPFGLAFDRAGNLYASDRYASRIMKYTPDGAGSVFASAGVSYPTGLAIDSAGTST